MSPEQSVAKVEDVKELHAYGAGLQSLSEIENLRQLVNLETLSLHGNRIRSMQGLEVLHRLRELNLSSNNITRMECLSHLAQLQVLNLSCNQISEISDVRGLYAVKKLLLSHNKISRLTGLSGLHGPRYSLEILDLRDNAVKFLSELEVLAGCFDLRELTLAMGNHVNPVCQSPTYKSTIIAAAPYLCKLDGLTISPGFEAGGSSRKPCLEVEQRPNSSSLLPSWALPYAGNDLQQPKDLHNGKHSTLQTADCSLSEPQSPTSNDETHQVRRLDGSYRSRNPQYPANIVEGLSHRRMSALAQPPISCSLFQNEGISLDAVLRSCRVTQNSSSLASARRPDDNLRSPASLDKQAFHLHMSTDSASPDVNRMLASSDLQLMRAGIHPHASDLTHLGAEHTSIIGERSGQRKNNLGKETAREVSTAGKVDSSDQTNQDVWLGALEEKILTLIQGLPVPQPLYPEAAKISCDNKTHAGPSSKTIRFQTLDHGDVPRPALESAQEHEQRNPKISSNRERRSTTESSSGGSCDKSAPRSQHLVSPPLGSGDSGSESAKPEPPARRWLHFSNKWSGRKDMARAKKPSGRKVNPAKEHGVHVQDLATSGGNSSSDSKVLEDRKAIMKLFAEVRNLKAGFTSLVATRGERDATQPVLQEQRATCTERRRSEERVALKSSTEKSSVISDRITGSDAKVSEEMRSHLQKLETEQEERRKFFEMLKMEQEQSSNLQKTLNSDLEAMKNLHERIEAEVKDRSDLQRSLEAKDYIITNLEKSFQDKCEQEQELRRETERILAERTKQEGLAQEHHHERLLSLNTEVISLKEALSIATQARQNAERAILDAVAEKETTKQHLHALNEECTKLKMCKSELEASRKREAELQNVVDKYAKDFLDAQRLKKKEIQQLVRLHEDEVEKAIARESALAHNRGIISAESGFEQRKIVLDMELTNARKELKEAHQASFRACKKARKKLKEADVVPRLTENARLKQEIDAVWEKNGKEEAVLKQTIRSLLQKEDGKEALVVQLSNVVRSQRMKLQAAQLDLEHLAETEEKLRKTQQEMVSMRRKADRCDELVAQVDDLQQRLSEAASAAARNIKGVENKFQAELSCIRNDNTRLTANLEKLQKAEDALKIKNKLLDSQNETIQGLKSELAQAKEAFKKALETSELLETDWIGRLQNEVNKGEALQQTLAEREHTVTSLEEKLKFERSAKFGAEKAAKALQEKLNEKESMFRYVEDEIEQVKELYDNKFKEEGEQGAEKLRIVQEERDALEKALLDSQTRAQELSDASEALQIQGALWKEDVKVKDQQLRIALQRVEESEAELKLQVCAMEQQKVSSAAKVNQLHRLVEEFRELNQDSEKDRLSVRANSS